MSTHSLQQKKIMSQVCSTRHVRMGRPISGGVNENFQVTYMYLFTFFRVLEFSRREMAENPQTACGYHKTLNAAQQMLYSS